MNARELDAIDVAYLQLERPMVVLRVARDVSIAQRESFLEQVREVTQYACALLPPGFDIQVIGPGYTCAPPADLARWADDGGPV